MSHRVLSCRLLEPPWRADFPVWTEGSVSVMVLSAESSVGHLSRPWAYSHEAASLRGSEAGATRGSFTEVGACWPLRSQRELPLQKCGLSTCTSRLPPRARGRGSAAGISELTSAACGSQ